MFFFFKESFATRCHINDYANLQRTVKSLSSEKYALRVNRCPGHEARRFVLDVTEFLIFRINCFILSLTVY